MVIIINNNDIYIAQIRKIQQMYYQQLNRKVFNCFLNTSRETSGDRSSTGNLFQTTGCRRLSLYGTRHNELACCGGSQVDPIRSNRTRVITYRSAGEIWPLASRLSGSLKVTGTDTDRSATLDFLLVIHSNRVFRTVSEINGDFCRKSQIFHSVDLTPPLGILQRR